MCIRDRFQKGFDSGELNILRKIDNIVVNRICSFKKFYYYMDEQEKSLYAKEHMQALESAIGMIANEPLRYDMLVLDEVLGAVSIGVIEERLLIKFIKTNPDDIVFYYIL